VHAERVLHAERARRLFPVLAWEPRRDLFLLEDQSLAFGFVCDPLCGADAGLAARAGVLLAQELPPDSLMQVLLFASPDIEAALGRMAWLRRDQADPLLAETVDSRARFLRAGTLAPLERASGVRVRDLRLVITVKVALRVAQPSERELARAGDARDGLAQALATVGLAGIEALDANRYVRLMSVMLNWAPGAGWRDLIEPEHDPNRLVRDQLLDPDTEIRVDAEGVALGARRVRLLSVKRYPETVAFGAALRYLGDPLTGARGLRESFLLGAVIHFPDAERAQARLGAARQWATNQAYGPLLKFIPALGARKHGFDVLFDALGRGERPVRLYMGLALFTDPEGQRAAVAAARTYWRELGFQLMEDRFFCLPLLLNLLPFGADRAGMRDLMRYRTMASGHVVALLPLLGDWKGTGTPVLNLVSRNGQLMSLDLFDSTSNYNCVIAAQSGSGKSFLTNELIASYLSAGARCWAIDVGRSYENLARALGGEFISFEPGARIGLNPFALVRHWEEEADVLAALLAAMASPTEPLGDFRRAGLKRVLKAVWEERAERTTVDEIARALLAEPDGRLRDVGEQLYPFTRAGEYGRFFAGPNTVRFAADLTVLELEELKGRKHLQQVVLLQLIYQIQQAMYLGQRDRRKVLLIDEAWDLLTGGDVARFIETGYRRFRKYGGAAVTITQSVNDLYATPTGRAIAENSANMLLLGQKDEAIEQVRREGRLALPEAGYALLRSLHTVPGAYSEIFAITEHGAGVGRLVVEPFKRLLYSTRAEDVHAIAALTAQGLSVAEAIERLLEEAGDGG